MKELLINLKFSWHYTKNQKKHIFMLIFTNIIYIIFNIVTPVLGAKIIVALTSNNYLQILFIAAVIFLTNALSALSNYVARRCYMRIYRRSLYALEVDLGSNILKLENSTLDKNGSGVFIQRMNSDASNIADALNMFIINVAEVIKYIGLLVAIFFVSKIYFIIEITILIIILLIERKRAIIRNKDDKVYRKSKEKVTGFVGELVRGSRDIKMLNSEKDFIEELSIKIDDANQKKIKMQLISWGYKLIRDELSSIFSFMQIGLLIILMKENIIAAALALVLYNYSNNVYNAIYLVEELLNYIKDFNLSSERIIAIINGKDFPKEKFGKRKILKANGDFEFRNVSFSYNDKKVLDNISFKIQANETVAFVGKSGAGKSTIFNLLCKMYEVDSGEILIDGIDIKKLDKDSIRGNITIISQSPYIFNMSIRDNLKLVKKDLTEEEMIKACETACLMEFIEDLPNGFDTIVGEGGMSLSGGQKQRLAIARALVQKTEIILFDEATSALDNETQAKIQDAIENMKNEYTILIIAHRLSTIKNASRILYLDNGKIICEGTHQELLKTSIDYQKLYSSEIKKD